MQNTSHIQQLMADVRHQTNKAGLMPDVVKSPSTTRKARQKRRPLLGDAKGEISTEQLNWDLMNPNEDIEQEALFNWLNEHPDQRCLLAFAIPNGTYKNKVAQYRHKVTGLKSGVPDLMLPVAAGGYHGLFIEMKRRKKGQLSAAQRQWLDSLTSQGYLAVVCRGWHEAKVVIDKYLGQYN
jgi:VRR-NUC domain